MERLLAGNFRPEDLNHLFLYLRSHTYSSWSVAEVGDFIAHRDERTKGPATQVARDFFYSMRLLFDQDMERGFASVPAFFPAVMWAQLRRIRPITIRHEVGMKSKDAKRVLSSALSKFETRSDGRLALVDFLTQAEHAVLYALSSHVISKPFLTGDKLFEDFGKVLQKNKLLRPTEAPLLSVIQPGVMLYAVAAMHQTTIRFDEASSAELTANRYDDGKIAVWASAESHRNRRVYFSFPMFTTELQASAWCEDSLLPPTDPLWRDAIEVTAQQKLAVLR